MNSITKVLLALAMSSVMTSVAAVPADAEPKYDVKEVNPNSEGNPSQLIEQFLQTINYKEGNQVFKESEETAYKIIQTVSNQGAAVNETVATVIKALDPKATSESIKNGTDFIYSTLKDLNTTSTQSGINNTPLSVVLQAIEDKENQKRVADTTAFFTNFFFPAFSQGTKDVANNAPLAKNSVEGLFPNNKEAEPSNAEFLMKVSNRVKTPSSAKSQKSSKK
ncbi:hypothetical protein DSO57_1004659 [Entomophthora muscae]|uniref:Uncharacterized protein n=1 Tax=Entomophthora muscae TaxID=34485 RepID=A0ACC2T7Z1_9FUNG|nr:hypothetical protein DSO57_1004659 [Entomophthora muscae]